MAFVGNLETNTLAGGGVSPFGAGFGGGFGGFGGGFGGIAPIGLVGINNLFGRDRDHDGGHGCKGRDNDGIEHPLAILAAIGNAKDTTVAESRALSNAVCEAEKTSLQQFYAAAIQSANNTNLLQAQTAAFQANVSSQFADVSRQIANDGDLTRALINQNTIADLRDSLHEVRRGRDLDSIRIENNNTNTNIQGQFQAQAQAQLQAQLDETRRRWDARENEINIVNTNTNINAQAQAQAQAQSIRDLDRDHRWNARFDALQSATAKANNEIINIGGLVAASQANTANPTNVNSK